MNTSNLSCPWTTIYAPFTETITYLTYTALSPIFFILGIVGHSAALVAFAKQRKTDSAYAYQIFVTAIKTYEILAFDLWILFFVHFADQDWTGQKGYGGWVWFRESTALMWFTATVVTVCQSASITLPILATTAMAFDRVLALWKPIRYKKMNKKKQQIISYVFCLVLGFLIGVDGAYRFEPIQTADGKAYRMTATIYPRTTLGVLTAQTRNAVRIIAELILISSSVAIIFLYKSYLNKVNSMTTQNDSQGSVSKSTQKMLYGLAMFHSASTALPTFLLTAHTIGNYLSPTFAICDGRVLAGGIDFILQLINAIDFYLLCLINDQFRVMILKSIKSNSITPAIAVSAN